MYITSYSISAYILLERYQYKYEVVHTIHSVFNTSVRLQVVLTIIYLVKHLSSYVRLILLC